MPLVLAEINKEYTITRIGGKAETKKHLNNLGFTVGEKIKLVSIHHGNVIVNVKEARIAIGEDLAKRIFV